MNSENDEVAAFFQHIQSVDTLKLSTLCSFQEGFEQSFYSSTLDEQKMTAASFAPSERIDLLHDIEKLTVENAKAFFHKFFQSEVFRQKFSEYFESRHPLIMEKARKIAGIQMAQRLINCGTSIEKIAEITKLTVSEIEKLK
jgi:hypothetical protein